MNIGKYKTVLCKHFGQNGTCSYGDKCQFAHGFQELKNSNVPTGVQNIIADPSKQKSVPNPANFKIIKCKNWETSGSCKYGSVCTFAHGDSELRTKSDNNIQMSENAITMDYNYMQNNMNPYLMQDPNYMYNMMLQQQMMGGGGMNAPTDMYSMYGMMGGYPNQNYPPMTGQNEINLNDQNNMFLQNQMPQSGMDPNLYYDQQGYNNMNMFMGVNNNQ